MSQKKNKKRKQHSPNTLDKNPKVLQQTEKSKRFEPLARGILYMDLVFMAICMFLDSNDMISPELSGACTVLGVVLLLIALYLQFGRKDRGVKDRRL